MRSQCPICVKFFFSASNISALMCGHTFHHDCLVQWLAMSKSCPKCRMEVTDLSVVQKLAFETEPDEFDNLIGMINHLETEIAESHIKWYKSETKLKKIELKISTTKDNLNLLAERVHVMKLNKNKEDSWFEAETALRDQRIKELEEKLKNVELENNKLRAEGTREQHLETTMLGMHVSSPLDQRSVAGEPDVHEDHQNGNVL